MTDTLNLRADVSIQAAADGKPARVSIMAYGGGAMDVAGFGPVAIELAGLSMPATIPLLGDHESTLAGVAGSGSPRIVNGSLYVDGTISSNDTGQRIVALSRDGVPLQASVGVSPNDRINIRTGDTATVNGKLLTAGQRGLTVVKAGTLREVSILPLGADPTTSVTIAATRKGHNVETETQAEVDPIQAERDRVKEIRTICAGEYRDIEAEAIDGGWPADRARANVLDAIRAARPRPSQTVPSHSPSQSATDMQAVEAGLLVRAGREELAVKHYGERAVELARHMRASSLVDICAHVMRLDHKDPAGLSRGEIVKAAFSTFSLPVALSNVMGKTLLDSYRQATEAWRGFCKVNSAANFKPQTGIRPSFIGELELLPPTGEIKHGRLAESTFPWSVDTYAKMFVVDRQDVINDDLGFIDQTPVLLGKAAARAVNDLIWRTIMANEGSFFNNTTHANLITNAMGSAGLTVAVNAMRSQRDDNDNDIYITPQVLAVPPPLEGLSRSLLVSEYLTQFVEAEATPTGNPWRSLFDLAVESRLGNTAKFDGASTTAWYLFGKPMDAAVIVGFLDGRETPIIETLGFDAQANVLALTFRCYHDFGASLGDWRAAVKSTGAGS